MKLVTYDYDGYTRIGALLADSSGETILDLNRADPHIPADMLSFLSAGNGARVLADRAVATAPSAAIVQRDAVKLRAPVPRPGKILCIGLNYRDHAAESNQPIPEYPTVFAKYANTVIGPGDAIVLPDASQEIDYEAEFAFVIGRRAKHVRAEDALQYVAGYMPLNDVSARDYQMRTSQWTMGKTPDTFAPTGPALVTSDEIADPHNLDISLSIGGEVLQSSNTSNLIFSVNDLIADVTAVMTLEPGDIISTGTPSGVGGARTPPRWLRPGDIVRLEIEGLGVLENPVVAES